MSNYLKDIGGFLKGVAAGAYDGGKDMVVSTAGLVKDTAIAGKNLIMDQNYREQVWSGAKEIAGEATIATSETEAWLGEQMKGMIANPEKKIGEIRQGVVEAYRSADSGLDKALEEFAKAEENARREGYLGEFYGKIVGRGGFELGSLLIPATKLSNIASITKAAKLGEGLSAVGKVSQGLESLGSGKKFINDVVAARNLAGKELGSRIRGDIAKALNGVSKRIGSVIGECPLLRNKLNAVSLLDYSNSGKEALRRGKRIKKTLPTGIKGGQPSGSPVTITDGTLAQAKAGNPKAQDVIRSLERENDTARVFAKNGFNVKQNPYPHDSLYAGQYVPKNRMPDFDIEGNLVDCYSPISKNADSILDGMQSKLNGYLDKKGKIKERQVERLVVNLENTTVTPGVLKQKLEDRLANKTDSEQLQHMKEVFVVKGESIFVIYP